MIRLGDKAPAVDSAYCRRLIAKAILFRAIEKIVSAREFGGYRANIVTYTIARLAHETGQRLDLDRIWREQRIGTALAAAIDDLCVPVHDVITRPVRVANVTEWAKRPECWSRVTDIDWQLSDRLRDELIDLSAAAARGRHAAANAESATETAEIAASLPSRQRLARRRPVGERNPQPAALAAADRPHRRPVPEQGLGRQRQAGRPGTPPYGRGDAPRLP
jgi:AIPR protein